MTATPVIGHTFDFSALIPNSTYWGITTFRYVTDVSAKQYHWAEIKRRRKMLFLEALGENPFLISSGSCHHCFVCGYFILSLVD